MQKKLLSFFISCGLGFSLMTSFPVFADDNGSPNFFIKGDFQNCNWNSLDFPMTRDGNHYSIHIDELNGEFKISNEDWTINYGASDSSTSRISESVYTDGLNNGPNFYGDNLKNVTISFDYTAGARTAEIKFVVNGIEPVRNDNPVIRHNYISGTLPVLYINIYDEFGNLNNEVISKDLSHKNYFSGNYWLDLNGCQWMEAMGAKSIGSREEPLPLEMKARGNYTRQAYSKKPFKLKLGKKQSLLGLTKSKHFAIIAHADDVFGYMRNFTGFNLGRRMGLPWTPDQQPVEVVINGDYRGVYFLTESIRVESERVNIQELDDNVSDPALASGGYLVELDNYEEVNQIRMEEKGQAWGFKDELRITFDTPEVYSDLQRNFVEYQFNAMNNAIGDNSDVLWSYMDLDDAARYYVVEEIVSHTESYHGSTYLFRDRGDNQKWHFSPLWDFGNAFNGPTDNYFTTQSPFGNTWIASMRMNEKFMAKVRETWKWFMSNKFEGLYDEIDTYAQRLKAAAESDYKRWHDQPLPNFYAASGVVDNRDMDSHRFRVKEHLKNKINWLKSQFGEYTDKIYLEPSRDTTPAAPLPSFIISGVEEIANVAACSENAVFTLDGVKVSNPEPGRIYIIVANGEAHKVLVK